MRLVFLGTGGGRSMMFTQVRKTGGLFFDLDDVKFIVDPGPGSLVHAQSLKLHPEKWNGILLSHHHVDNSSDVNVLLDGMKADFLVAEEHCILPNKKFGGKKYDYFPCVTVYHQQRVKNLCSAKHGDVFKVNGVEIHAYRSTHYGPTVGFMVIHPKIKIGYPADGPYYDGQEKHYDGCDVLILNVLVPKGMKPDVEKHMSVDDAIKFVKSMKSKPKIIILQHFSFWMLRHNIWKQAKILHEATKVRVVTAEDFMEIDLSIFKTRILKPESKR